MVRTSSQERSFFKAFLNIPDLVAKECPLPSNRDHLGVTAHLIVRDAASLATAMSDNSEGTTFGGFSEYSELCCQGMAFP